MLQLSAEAATKEVASESSSKSAVFSHIAYPRKRHVMKALPPHAERDPHRRPRRITKGVKMKHMTNSIGQIHMSLTHTIYNYTCSRPWSLSSVSTSRNPLHRNIVDRNIRYTGAARRWTMQTINLISYTTADHTILPVKNLLTTCTYSYWLFLRCLLL